MADTYPDLFWSYTIVWFVLALYLWSLGVRLSKLERMTGKLEERSDDNPPVRSS